MDDISLYYREGSSDKVYHIGIERTGDLSRETYTVNFAYGRRGATLQTGTKSVYPSYGQARAVRDKVISEKLAKGYKFVASEEATAAVSTNGSNSTYAASTVITDREQRQTGLYPQLLNPIDEAEMGQLLRDEEWCAQQKYDGVRMLIRKKGRTVEAINRLGFTRGIPRAIEESFQRYGQDFLADGEAVGETFHAFDLLKSAGQDLRELPYHQRYLALMNLVAGNPPAGGHILLVESAQEEQEKLALLRGLRARNAEGVVFKHQDAAYVSGRPASGGNQRKFKFYETASVIVVGINAKRSVAIAVYEPNSEVDGHLVSVGNVTIPPNRLIPEVGSIVECRYLYAFPPPGSLFQPTYLGERDDITQEECTAGQLKIKPE